MKYSLHYPRVLSALALLSVLPIQGFAQLPSASPSPLTSKAAAPVVSKEALANRKFRYQRPNHRPEIVLTLMPDGTVQGNDHPNEARWEINPAGQLILKNNAGKFSNVFDKAGGGDGPTRFTGYYATDKRERVSLTEVK